MRVHRYAREDIETRYHAVQHKKIHVFLKDLTQKYCVVRCFDVIMRVDGEKSGGNHPPPEEKEQRVCLGR